MPARVARSVKQRPGAQSPRVLPDEKADTGKLRVMDLQWGNSKAMQRNSLLHRGSRTFDATLRLLVADLSQRR
jgi:hypothetical protein